MNILNWCFCVRYAFRFEETGENEYVFINNGMMEVFFSFR